MSVHNTICAISTPPGQGGIAVIRVSGDKAFDIGSRVFFQGDKYIGLHNQKTHTLHFGQIADKGKTLDEVLLAIFVKPLSYTGEDVIEISCHGSSYIQQKILELLIKHGARLAQPGEFTLRAFMNGKMDLSQAEAVADLISSQTEASHRIAMEQMRGGISHQLKGLRDQLLHFTSLIELELDFSEEDVEFASRDDFNALLDKIHTGASKLLASFELGNAIKEGIPITIAGNPNVGKSTLLNTILNEEKAIVSEIAGTTRDAIEDVVNIKGIAFRFIDTAGLRETHDEVEKIGISRSLEKIDKARIILYLADATDAPEDIINQVGQIKVKSNQVLYLLLNKKDKLPENKHQHLLEQLPFDRVHLVSAKDPLDVEKLLEHLYNDINRGMVQYDNVVLSNLRHAEALGRARESVEQVQEGIKAGVSTDLLAVDIRGILHYLGEITGEITTDEILGNIFKNFCIGK